MNTRNKILLTILVALVLIQFIRPEKNISVAESKNDIFLTHPAPDSVRSLVHSSCYDCHSKTKPNILGTLKFSPWVYG